MSRISDNNRRIVKNTLYMYMRMFVTLCISLFTARIVFNTLGVDNYGIYNVVGGVIVFFSFINESLLGATGRYITAEIAQGTIDSQRKVFSVACQCHFFIAFLVVLGGETVGLWFLNNVMNIPEQRMFAANVVYQLSIVSAVLGIFQAPLSSLIVSHEKMSIYAYFSILDVVFKLVIVYFVQAIIGDKLIIYSVLILCITIINFLIYLIYCFRNMPDCRLVKAKDIELLKGIFGYMGCTLFGVGAHMTTNQGISMLINIFYGVTVNAAMGISNAITNVVRNFVSSFQISFRPQITKYYVSKDVVELNKLTTRAGRYSAFLVLIFLVPICFEIKDFLTIWLGDYPRYSVEFAILTLVCVFFESIATPLIYLLGSDKDIRLYTVVISSLYLMNFLLCWLFLSYGMQPWGVIVIRILIDVLLVFGRLGLMRNRFYNFPILKWIKDVMLDSFLILVAPILSGIIMLHINIGIIWFRLLAVSCVCFLVTVFSICTIGLNSQERLFIWLKIKEKFKK